MTRRDDLTRKLIAAAAAGQAEECAALIEAGADVKAAMRMVQDSLPAADADAEGSE